MTKTFEEYLEDIAKNGDRFPRLKSEMPELKFKISGINGLSIDFKENIYLNYGNINEDKKIVAIEFYQNLYDDLGSKSFKAYLSDNLLYLDFNTTYYYVLPCFDDSKQYQNCIKSEFITIALLNKNNSDIINKWTTHINLL